MIKLEMKPSPRLVQQVARIERFCGYWDKAIINNLSLVEELQAPSIIAGSISALKLDNTTPPKTSIQIGNIIEITKEKDFFLSDLTEFTKGHEFSIELDSDKLTELFYALQTSNSSNSGKPFRKLAVNFTAPSLLATRGFNSTVALDKEEIIFPAVSSFLVENRLEELLEWTKEQLLEAQFHPLFVIGTFHLLFLQIHPFETANHRIALLLLWHLLDAHGFSFVRYSHFAEIFELRSKQYFSSLRQAEKTAGNSWATLNIWLEFFLDALISSSEKLLDNAEKKLGFYRLTDVQQQIIDVVKVTGAASREKIVSETGINVSTVKYNLTVLSTKGHLKRDGNGRTTSYSVI